MPAPRRTFLICAWLRIVQALKEHYGNDFLSSTKTTHNLSAITAACPWKERGTPAHTHFSVLEESNTGPHFRNRHFPTSLSAAHLRSKFHDSENFPSQPTSVINAYLQPLTVNMSPYPKRKREEISYKETPESDDFAASGGDNDDDKEGEEDDWYKTKKVRYSSLRASVCWACLISYPRRPKSGRSRRSASLASPGSSHSCTPISQCRSSCKCLVPC